MAFRMRKIEVWAGELSDQPGAAAAKLELLARSGADLEFVFTRPQRHRPDNLVLFLAPIQGPEQVLAAQAVGLAPAEDVTMLCVEGDNRPGLGYELVSRLAGSGVNLQGLSMASVGDRFAAYLAFDTADLATLALYILSVIF